MKIIERVHNIETGEIIDTQRDETPEEKKEREIYLSLIQQENEEKAKKETARAAILEKLGLTEEEAKLLLG